MTKRVLVVIGSALAAILLPPLLALLGPPSLRDYAYRELAYRVIADEVTSGATTDRAVVLAVYTFITQHEYQPAGATPIDSTVFSDLVRGIGWCDQQAWGLSTLLEKKGIRSTMLMLRGRHPESQHTVATVFLEGKWRIVDPYYRLIFRTPSNEWATFEDLQRAAQTALVSPNSEALSRFEPDFKQNYFSLFEHQYPPVRWRGVAESKSASRRTVDAIVDVYVRLFGTRFAYAFQDAYLWRQRQDSMETQLFVRARHYDLFFRRGPALRAYARLEAGDADGRYAPDSRYFLGRAQEDLGQWREAAATFAALTSRQDGGAQWRPLAPYFLGLAFERTGNPEQALTEYTIAATAAQRDPRIRLASLRTP